jgi:hypothetical protein
MKSCGMQIILLGKSYFKEFTEYTEQYFSGESFGKEVILGNVKEMQ